MEPLGTIFTVLLSDLVTSTDLIQQIGAEIAQRLVQHHRKLLKEACN